MVASATIAASASRQTTAALTNYSSVNGGPDFTPGVDPQDTADQTVAAPVIAKVFANGTLTDDDSSATHTTGANLVIGESMLYDIVVTLPEGTTQSLRVNDLIPAGHEPRHQLRQRWLPDHHHHGGKRCARRQLCRLRHRRQRQRTGRRRRRPCA